LRKERRRSLSNLSSNNSNSNSNNNMARKLTKCCDQETCKYLHQGLATKENKMVMQYGYAGMGTYLPGNPRKHKHFYCAFAVIAKTDKNDSPDCATQAARKISPKAH
jgi:hypothetical protein